MSILDPLGTIHWIDPDAVQLLALEPQRIPVEFFRSGWIARIEAWERDSGDRGTLGSSLRPHGSDSNDGKRKQLGSSHELKP
jgi:hypothetical protein